MRTCWDRLVGLQLDEIADTQILPSNLLPDCLLRVLDRMAKEAAMMSAHTGRDWGISFLGIGIGITRLDVLQRDVTLGALAGGLNIAAAGRIARHL